MKLHSRIRPSKASKGLPIVKKRHYSVSEKKEWESIGEWGFTQTNPHLLKKTIDATLHQMHIQNYADFFHAYRVGFWRMKLDNFLKNSKST
jgi:hypothetical protein